MPFWYKKNYNKNSWSDVVSSRPRVLNLKKKTFVFEPYKFWLFLVNGKNKLYLLTTVFILVTTFGIYKVVTYANTLNLYATSCLGGWENPHLATGAPEVIEEASFTDQNSSILRSNAHGQIFCGGFQGDILEEAVPKKITIRFSWQAFYESELIPNISTTTEGLIENETGTSTDNFLEGEFSTSTENNTEEEVIDNVEDEVVPEESNIENNQLNDGVVPEVVPEVIPENQDNSSNETSNVTEEPISFLRFLYKVAYAEEEIVIENNEEITSTTTEGVEEVIEEIIPYGLVEVVYTLDGVNWKSLGFVEKNQFKAQHFEIPIEEAKNWEDISRIQIGVRSVPILDGNPVIIYFDSVWIEVLYENVDTNQVDKVEDQSLSASFVELIKDFFNKDDVIADENVEQVIVEEELVFDTNYDNEPVLGEGAGESRSNPEFLNENYSLLSLKNRVVEEVSIDPEARHSCGPANFSYQFKDNKTISIRLDLVNDSKGGILKIGSLPYGIDATFSDNNQYEISVDKKIKKLDLLFSKEFGAQEGSFNITIIYKIDSDKESYNLCQINIIN